MTLLTIIYSLFCISVLLLFYPLIEHVRDFFIFEKKFKEFQSLRNKFIRYVKKLDPSDIGLVSGSTLEYSFNKENRRIKDLQKDYEKEEYIRLLSNIEEVKKRISFLEESFKNTEYFIIKNRNEMFKELGI